MSTLRASAQAVSGLSGCSRAPPGVSIGGPPGQGRPTRRAISGGRGSARGEVQALRRGELAQYSFGRWG
eukprot:3942632-Pyramimonas_sp.AAC.1